MPHLDVPGARLRYEEDGHASAPALLLLHAGIADLRMWDPIVPALAADHRVVRVDARGSGGTSTEDVAFDPRADALDVLGHLGIERATVIGCSRGGALALDLAVAHPDRVVGLVVVAPGVGGFPYPDPTEEEDRRFDEVDEALRRGDDRERARLEASLWAFGTDRAAADLDPGFVSAVLDMADTLAEHAGEHPRPEPLDPPVYDRLVDLTVPVLALVGAHDLAESLAVHAFLLDAVPGAAGYVFPEAAHLPSLECSDEFLAALQPWLRAHGL